MPLALFILDSCHWHNTERGSMTSETRNAKNISGICISDAIEAYITQSDTEELVLEAYSGYLPHIISKVRNGILYIYYDSDLEDLFMHGDYRTKASISLKSLINITASGASKVKGTGNFQSENLNIRISGASEVDLSVITANIISCDASGASEIALSGTASTINIDELSGASKFYCFNLIAEKSYIRVTGASKAEIYVTQYLEVSASGASKVKYKGNPNTIKQHISGASEIIEE